MKIAFYTLGCKVNQYETQALKERFGDLGYEIVDELEYADVYVVNTCTVTNLADRKSRQYIRRMKRVNPESITAVIGCYAQVSPNQVQSIEGVDIIAGTNEKNKLPDYIEKYRQAKIRITHIKPYKELTEYEESGSITEMDSRTRAYIKVQEGCNQFCSYCIIPYARGGIRSRGLTEICNEAKNLIESGFKELVLTGINTALYGMEHKDRGFDGGLGIETVLGELEEMKGDFRIRLGSLEPTVVQAKNVESLIKYKKLCPHMHLSIQSGSDRILKKMNRHYNRSMYLEIVETLRSYDPSYGITTDIIVGFPGETEEDFMESMRLVEEVGFLKVHVFPYSVRPGTAAANMDEQVDSSVKKARSKRLTEAAEESARRFLRSTLGNTRPVIFEEYEQETGILTGYADNFIKVHCKGLDKEQADQLLDRIIPVKFTDLFQEGVYGTV